MVEINLFRRIIIQYSLTKLVFDIWSQYSYCTALQENINWSSMFQCTLCRVFFTFFSPPPPKHLFSSKGSCFQSYCTFCTLCTLLVLEEINRFQMFVHFDLFWNSLRRRYDMSHMTCDMSHMTCQMSLQGLIP